MAQSGEERRRQILKEIKEKSEPNSSYFQEFLIEYELLSEYRLLQKNGPHNGVYVIPSHKSALIWFGVIFVRSGPYAEGVFKFRIHIPHDYPANSLPPTLVFDPPIYHPMVEEDSGAVNFQAIFSNWTHPVSFNVSMLALKVTSEKPYLAHYSTYASIILKSGRQSRSSCK